MKFLDYLCQGSLDKILVSFQGSWGSLIEYCSSEYFPDDTYVHSEMTDSALHEILEGAVKDRMAYDFYNCNYWDLEAHSLRNFIDVHCDCVQSICSAIDYTRRQYALYIIHQPYRRLDRELFITTKASYQSNEILFLVGLVRAIRPEIQSYTNYFSDDNESLSDGCASVKGASSPDVYSPVHSDNEHDNQDSNGSLMVRVSSPDVSLYMQPDEDNEGPSECVYSSDEELFNGKVKSISIIGGSASSTVQGGGSASFFRESIGLRCRHSTSTGDTQEVSQSVTSHLNFPTLK